MSAIQVRRHTGQVSTTDLTTVLLLNGARACRVNKTEQMCATIEKQVN